jgi:hypothetical protein
MGALEAELPAIDIATPQQLTHLFSTSPGGRMRSNIQDADRDHEEDLLDEALRDTFPASDVPSIEFGTPEIRDPSPAVHDIPSELKTETLSQYP